MHPNIKKNNDRTVINIDLGKNDLVVMKNIDEKKLLLQLAKRVKELRVEKGLTQEQAYNDTGIHFGRIEQGKRDASYTTVYRISKYFNISIEDFFRKGFNE